MKYNFFVLQLLFVLFFVSCEKNSPEPNIIEFEKQQVVSFYDWKIISPNGNSQNFITKTNKVNFVYYWSTSDKENLDNLDRLEKFYNKYNTKLEFVFITKDNQVDVRNFIKANGYTFPVFFSLSPIPSPMKMDEYSRAYLISKKGRIVVDNLGLANWNSNLFYEIVDGLIKQ